MNDLSQFVCLLERDYNAPTLALEAKTDTDLT